MLTRTRRLIICLASAAVALHLAGRAAAGPEFPSDAVIPGEIRIPYPTVIHLSVEWSLGGDDNDNASCTMRFRRIGHPGWREGLPLRYVREGLNEKAWPPRSWGRKFSGSLFDLRPDTGYEIALDLHDPDGGSAKRLVRARTRPVPRVPASPVARRVDPASIASAARPGDVLLLAAGFYGVFTVPRDGEPGKPIVYRSIGGGAVFERIILAGRHHVVLDGLTVRNPHRSDAWPTPPEVQAVVMAGASDCVVRHCTIDSVYGITAYLPGATNCYIADNVVRGITAWTMEAMGAEGRNLGEGIEITGPGNVICHNRVTGFRDGISFMEDDRVGEQVSIDVYLNDIENAADDGIEADFAMGNCRIVRNRITNAHVGLSSQPGIGGPTYFIRNVMYNLNYSPAKLHRGSQGDVFLHNTVVKMGDGLLCLTKDPFDHALFRNNLFVGGRYPGEWRPKYPVGSEMAVRMPAAGPHCDFDYDAYGAWNIAFQGILGAQRFSSVSEMRRGPHEQHGIAVDMGVFLRVAFPEHAVPGYSAPDLRPAAGSKVVDAGVRLANVNDDFLGNAPDLGAYEAGAPLPPYGPRLDGADEATSGEEGNSR